MNRVRNQQVLEATLEWGRELPGFLPAHALHGVMLTEAFAAGVQDTRGEWIPGLGEDEPALRLAAMDLACILWVDDWFDTREHTSREVEPGESLVKVLLGGSATTPEAVGLARLRDRFRAAARDPDDHRLWAETLIDVVRASQEDRRVSRGERTRTWGEYLRDGEHNIAAAHMAFTLSLAYDLGLSTRAAEPRFRRALSHLCLAMRLRNDLASAEKERREGNRANGLFVLERYLSPEQAFAFVDAERLGYERMLAREVEALGPYHPFPRIARVMVAAVERFYQLPDSRYADAP
ncbi:terpene synthase family protein [Archangium sp.]|jgi:hypothetical protein|uniref:terpene synthase family protein n=1 Tax=Archangium sp. TaxID=1872627 RepID=UPI002ED98FE5